jgi:type IV secretory pathway TraG/TraD family ATPase VirD4
MDKLNAFIATLPSIEHLSLQDWAWALLYFSGAVITLMLVRTFLMLAGRVFGFYHPKFYRYFPHLPWRPVHKILITILLWKERCFSIGKKATGGFASTIETFALRYKSGQLLLGRAYGFGMGLLQPIGLSVSKHIFILAATGSGKTIALITMLSTWTNSVFLIDPKGQVTRALAFLDWRKWFVIDPYHLTGRASASFNAFDCIEAAVKREGDESAAVLWASRIAYALIVTPSGSRTPYFYDVARAFLTGLILHIYTEHPKSEWHLPYVRKLIVEGYRVYNKDGTEETKGTEAHDLLLSMMAKNTAFDGAISGAAAAMTKASGETGGNLWSTLQDQTRFLDLPNVAAVLMKTSLPLSALKTRGDVVLSFVAPVSSIRQELAPLARLLTNMSAYTFEAVEERNGTCLTMVDELPSQGYNETFLTTLAVGRSQGQLLVAIAQNIGQMKSVYPKDYASFIGETDAVLWMGGNHPETNNMLSNLLGKKTIVEKDRDSGRKTYRDVDVMDAEQVRRFLNSGRIIVTRTGGRASRLMNEPYFKALPVWAYSPDPDHKEALLRRFTRWCCVGTSQ